MYAEITKDLTRADLAKGATADLGFKAPTLALIRDIHHKVAELLASGLRPIEVSRITGMSSVRISVIKNDPTFIELLKFYREGQQEEAVKDVNRLQMLSRTAVGELQSRIEERPEEMKTADVLKIAAFGADRTGHGPSTTVNQRVAVLTADDVLRLKQEAHSHGVKIIPAEDRESGERMALLRGPAGDREDQQGAELEGSSQARLELRAESIETLTPDELARREA